MRVDEIRHKYKIDSEDVEVIRTKLKEEIKKVHPDNNGGKCDAEYLEEIIADFEYLGTLQKDSKKKELVAIPEDVMGYLVNIAQQREFISREEKLCSKLSDSVEVQIKTFKNRFRKKKYGLASVTAVLTFLWTFPETIIEHPIFQFWSEQNISPYNSRFAILVLSILWLYACMITVMYWILTERVERYEKYTLENIKLESVQNTIFMEFVESLEDVKKFSKSKFMEFVVHYLYKDKQRFLRMRLFKEGSYIGEDVLQNVADVILNRAIDHNLIKKVDQFSLIDYYEILN